MSRETESLRSQREKRSPKSETEFYLRKESQRIGLVGILFGERENAALYIVSGILLISIFFLGAVMFIDENLRPDIVTTIGAIGVAVLGYIGGLLKK